MDIRITPEDQATMQRLGIAPQLADVLRVYRAMSSWPWRECWVVPVVGVVLFHFRRWDDLRGEYRRIAFGVLGLKNTLHTDPLGEMPGFHGPSIGVSAQVVADKILSWANGQRPARPLANLSPLLPALKHPVGVVHHDTAVQA